MDQTNRVIDQFFGDQTTAIDWSSDEEKRLHFWLDDLHCPRPISPMWFDVGGWWLTCRYMYRRFGVPFGRDWVAKTVDGYVMSAVVPREAREAAELQPYFEMVMPVYGEQFADWWKGRYLPEILRNFAYLDTFPADTASLAELMILFEDALDIQERHFRLHWILNLAQFQSSVGFEQELVRLLGAERKPLLGRILVSDEDRNWDSLRDLWRLKERVKRDARLVRAFREETAPGVLQALSASETGRELVTAIEAYASEFGYKSMYAHEYVYPTWKEDPTPIVDALRQQLLSDYDYEAAVRQLRASRDGAIAEMWALVPAGTPPRDRERLQQALDVALKMTPLTPDHHFYMDQGTYARVRLVLMAIGRRLVERGVCTQPDDVMFLRYHELRVLSANHAAFDARAVIQARRAAWRAAADVKPRLWAGTITEWSLYREPYKSNWGWPDLYERSKTAAQPAPAAIRGLGASAGVVEGPARVVESAEQFGQVAKGDVLVCRMTNPAWVVLFTRIAGLVTDAGGTLSHPAVVSREFGIPAVVGTAVATQRIKTGQRVRVDGEAGVVEIVG